MSLHYQRTLDVRGSYGVVVAGAGPSGLCAAVAAARAGADVALVERFGVVGGNLTHGHVGPVMGEVCRGTMADELSSLVGVRHTDFLYRDPETAKIRLTQWSDHPRIRVFLNTPVMDVLTDGNAVTGIVAGSQSGPYALNGKIVVDATGDGVVSALAGCPWDIGRPGDGLMQPASVMFTLENIAPWQKILCRNSVSDTTIGDSTYLQLCRKACREGELPGNVNIVRLYRTQYDGERIVNATQSNYVNGVLPEDIQAAQLELRSQMSMIVAFLRKYVPGFEDCRIKDSSDAVGFRETRRIRCDYTINSEDLMAGKTFQDVMVHGARFHLDIHNPDGPGQAETKGRPPRTGRFDIPYRCFLPSGVENLYVTGRCIAGTHRAHSAYRVMNICMAMGEAVGEAAALCLREKTTPRRLDVRLVQNALIGRGIDLLSPCAEEEET